jgi:hypothetical protein
MLRAVLIVAVALVTSASADLWTASPAPPGERTLAPPTARPLRPNDASRDGARDPAFTLTLVVDPACPVSAAVLQDALAFARVHRDVAVRILLANQRMRSRNDMGAFVAAAEGGATVAWAPGAVRRLAPTALPAVYLEDGDGRGARATGRPPLEMLWRAALERSGA